MTKRQLEVDEDTFKSPSKKQKLNHSDVPKKTERFDSQKIKIVQKITDFSDNLCVLVLKFANVDPHDMNHLSKTYFREKRVFYILVVFLSDFSSVCIITCAMQNCEFEGIKSGDFVETMGDWGESFTCKECYPKVSKNENYTACGTCGRFDKPENMYKLSQILLIEHLFSI